jgi:TATA-box binding protein (TBP) (component of TFIID and TFIIIB)
MNKASAAKKIQNIFRRKRVFSNTPITGTVIKVSKPKITAQIVNFKTTIDLESIFDHAPKGFTEVTGYSKSFRKADVRYVVGNGWVGDADGITKVAAKKGKQTVMITGNTVEVLGAGNYEAALLGVVKNGWAPKSLLRAVPNFKKIDGQFNVNKDFSLTDLHDELKNLPDALGPKVNPYEPEIFPAVVLKLSKLGWTYQFFKNGTVLFSGVKNLADIDLPAELFKKFFTEFGVSTFVFGSTAARIRLPNKAGANKGAKLAERYELAGTWNALKKPPRGFYIRPGTNGKPRFYPWLRVEKKAYNVGENMPYVNVKYFPMNLKAVAPKVVKAFKNAGHNIPQSTINAFAEGGAPLPVNQNGKSAAKLGERRAPSWNATRPGFYVRPGPGQQPYWFKVPKGLASGRKTVIETYTKAGRNIPQAVRNTFKIGNNIQTAGEAREHKVVMGLNKILRINNRQATRLTKKELLAIARNMNIPQVSEKMKPGEIIGWIQNKAGVGANPNRTYDVLVNGMFYKFMKDGRVERTTNKGVRTTRNWATLPAAEQNKIAKEVIPANLHAEWNTVAKANRYNTIRAVAAGKKPPKVKTPSPPKVNTPSPSSTGSSINNFGKELELALKLEANLGNKYMKGNEETLMKILGKLPVGKRGKVLKANENRTYKKFVKETTTLRANAAPRARFMARIQVPNWMPANKAQAYKNLVTNLAFQKPKPSQKNLKAAVKKWIANTVPQSPARAAKVVENMITGEIKHIPAYVPRPRTSPVIPKRSPAKRT